ncbi:MAG TPA: hemerythrin domain-containing protein [candidate division Zixibacteria bacterium]|nr:hemerythrin domain-containing protein [candidate division Zixibacteria bacterium]
MGTNASFLDLLKVHERIDDLFLSHQEALLCLDLDRAAEILVAYEAELLTHMGDEEEHLLPVYQGRAGKIPGGSVELFVGEHKKMKNFLAEFRQALPNLRGEQDSRLRRSVIALLDRQFMYKHLVEHHDLREQNVLYPVLDRVTTEAERISIFRRLRQSS